MSKSEKFTREEKKFWQRNYHIEKPDNIPADWHSFHSADSDCDDEFFYFLSLRVHSLQDIYLKSSVITDQAIEYMLNFKNLHSLFLRKNRLLSNGSIKYFNQMKNLRRLDITATGINLAGLRDYLDNPVLRKIFIDSDESEEEIEEKASILKLMVPDCKIYLNCSHSTDVFGNPEKPIF